jgi:hypothetical protein
MPSEIQEAPNHNKKKMTMIPRKKKKEDDNDARPVGYDGHIAVDMNASEFNIRNSSYYQ